MMTDVPAWLRRYLARAGAIKPLCDLLDHTDSRIILVCLDAISQILQAGDKESKSGRGVNPYTQLVEEAEGLDKLESLEQHTNNEIYEKAVSILEKHFCAEEEDQNISPNTVAVPSNDLNPGAAPQCQFSFGVNQANFAAGFTF